MWGRELLVAGHFLGNMGVSINGGTSKWMVYNETSYTNGWFRGTPILGHPHSLSSAHRSAQVPGRASHHGGQMRSLRPVERLSEGQLRCADATVAKHHIVLGTVRKWREGWRDPTQVSGIWEMLWHCGTVLCRPSRTLSTNKCVRVYGMWSSIIIYPILGNPIMMRI